MNKPMTTSTQLSFTPVISRLCGSDAAPARLILAREPPIREPVLFLSIRRPMPARSAARVITASSRPVNPQRIFQRRLIVTIAIPHGMEVIKRTVINLEHK